MVGVITGASVVVAAGAVCWRIVDGTPRVLLVHRSAHADVSLPKGKLNPGESSPQAAVREIEEETGIRVALGVPLGSVRYRLADGRKKTVHYWAAEVTDEAMAASTFEPNREIAALQWLTLDAAASALSYERDRDVLDRFLEFVERGTVRTFAVIALRHGKAVPQQNWDGPDSSRPLLHRGLDQAAAIAPAIAAWHPARLISSTAARCLATMEPLAKLTGLSVKAVKGLSQDAHERGAGTVEHVVAKRIAARESVVLCSHGPVLPGMIAAVAAHTGTDVVPALQRAAMLGTAEFSVMHVSRDHPDGGLVAVEHHGPPRRG